MAGYRRRMAAMADRFDNYKPIVAKFNSQCGNKCAAPIAKGDYIGFHPGLKKVICEGCWRKWTAENREAADYERMHPQCSDLYDGHDIGTYQEY